MIVTVRSSPVTVKTLVTGVGDQVDVSNVVGVEVVLGVEEEEEDADVDDDDGVEGVGDGVVSSGVEVDSGSDVEVVGVAEFVASVSVLVGASVLEGAPWVPDGALLRAMYP